MYHAPRSSQLCPRETLAPCASCRSQQIHWRAPHAPSGVRLDLFYRNAFSHRRGPKTVPHIRTELQHCRLHFFLLSFTLTTCFCMLACEGESVESHNFGMKKGNGFTLTSSVLSLLFLNSSMSFSSFLISALAAVCFSCAALTAASISAMDRLSSATCVPI